MPFWAMGALSLLPLWGFMYVRSVTDQAAAATGPLGVGAEVYGSCASCHGGTGGGGVGYPFANGEVLETFPHIEDQLRFVYYGTARYNIGRRRRLRQPRPRGRPAPDRRPRADAGVGRGANGELTDAEMLAVVCHERYTLGGADETADVRRGVREVVLGGIRDLRRSRSGRLHAADARGIGRGHHPDRHRAGPRFASRRG